jgi:hypothetical protein
MLARAKREKKMKKKKKVPLRPNAPYHYAITDPCQPTTTALRGKHVAIAIKTESLWL